MITQKFKNLILLSIPTFGLHGAEEYLTQFYQTDPLSRSFFKIFESMGSLQATFLLFQIGVVILLTVAYILLKGGKGTLYLATFLGFIFLLELDHLIKALDSLSYYPGIVSAVFVYILGFFYWKELINIWRKQW